MHASFKRGSAGVAPTQCDHESHRLRLSVCRLSSEVVSDTHAPELTRWRLRHARGPGIKEVQVRIHSSSDDTANRRALGAVEAIAGAVRPMPLSVTLLDEPEVLRPGQLRPHLALPAASTALERNLVSLKGPLTLGVLYTRFLHLCLCQCTFMLPCHITLSSQFAYESLCLFCRVLPAATNASSYAHSALQRMQ